MYDLIGQYWDQKALETEELWKLAAGEEKDKLGNQLIFNLGGRLPKRD